jgi:hypothetical protein
MAEASPTLQWPSEQGSSIALQPLFIGAAVLTSWQYGLWHTWLLSSWSQRPWARQYGDRAMGMDGCEDP